MTPIVPVLGYGLMLWSSMLNRGAAQSWARGDDGHDWAPDNERSYFTRSIAFMAGLPAFVTMTVACVRALGWWTPLVVAGGLPAAFGLNMLLLGGSPARVAQRMRMVRLPVSFGAIVTTLVFAALT